MASMVVCGVPKVCPEVCSKVCRKAAPNIVASVVFQRMLCAFGSRASANEHYLFVFFDSNDIHRVNEQLSGKRIVEIYKFYNK